MTNLKISMLVGALATSAIAASTLTGCGASMTMAPPATAPSSSGTSSSVTSSLPAPSPTTAPSSYASAPARARDTALTWTERSDRTGQFTLELPSTWTKKIVTDQTTVWSTPDNKSAATIQIDPVSTDNYVFDMTGFVESDWNCTLISEVSADRAGRCDSPKEGAHASTPMCAQVMSREQGTHRTGYARMMVPGSCASNAALLDHIRAHAHWR